MLQTRIQKSYWDGQLMFRSREGAFSAKDISFQGDEDKMWEMADKYLNSSHRYNATKS